MSLTVVVATIACGDAEVAAELIERFHQLNWLSRFERLFDERNGQQPFHASPVIGLSAAALPRDTARAKEVAFYRYLTKPVKVDQLAATFEELLDRPAPDSADR